MTAGAMTYVSKPPPSFPSYHRWDRNFFLILVGLIWLGIVSGFGWDVVDHLKKHQPNWPLIVHLHALFFVGWLVLLTTQILLIRSRNVALHRRLGVAGAGLAAIMVVLAVATSVVMDNHYLGTKDADPAFLSIQLADVIGFPVLAGAGLLLRADSAAHKRLILLATLQISDAGFSRLEGFLFPTLYGHGFWSDWLAFYAGNGVLILGLGVFDLVTRKRLNSAYLAGAALIYGLQVSMLWLYLDPAWKPLALKLLGH